MPAAMWTFDLARHDEPDDPPPQDPPADPPEDPPTDPPNQDPASDPAPADDGKPDEPGPEGKDGDGKDYKAEAEKWKALARKHEKTAKDNSAAAKKLTEIEDAKKTETERLAAAKEAAEKRAAAAIERAVRAEVKALATDFVDPTDAESAINPADFTGDDGEIDTGAIKSRLAEILESKPHWRKPPPEPPAKPKPKPDPGQGARGETKPTSFKDASQEDFAAELAKHRLRSRS